MKRQSATKKVSWCNLLRERACAKCRVAKEEEAAKDQKTMQRYAHLWGLSKLSYLFFIPCVIITYILLTSSVLFYFLFLVQPNFPPRFSLAVVSLFIHIIFIWYSLTTLRILFFCFLACSSLSFCFFSFVGFLTFWKQVQWLFVAFLAVHFLRSSLVVFVAFRLSFSRLA